MSHGLWACHRHSGPRTRRIHSQVLFHTMDRTRDLARGSWHQGDRRLRLRDDRDRGMSLNVVAISRIIHRYKITSGTAPFADSSPTSVAAKVMMGKRPERPKDQILTNGLWTLTKRCLEGDPQRRPEITEVIYYLRKTLTSLQDYADGSDLATSDDTTLGSAQKRELLYRTSSFINSFEVTPIGSKDTCCSIPGCQLWRRCKSKRLLSENRPTSDSIGSVKSREPDTREGGQSIRL